MTTYNEDTHFSEALRKGELLTPVPESLTVHWSDDTNYYFDEVYDGSSLIWIDLMIETFSEVLPDVDWGVDDPGVLYDQGSEDYEDYEESPHPLDKMQEAADIALARYTSLFKRLEAEGVEVVDPDES